jgi:PTS system cellobiose-specific IIA component
MNTIIEEKTVKIATMVILHAGNARKFVNEAIKAIANGDSELATEKYTQAKEEIHSAHKIQTEVIQEEAKGNQLQMTLLLSHAQDSLMVALSEVQMARHIMDLYKQVNALEARLETTSN